MTSTCPFIITRGKNKGSPCNRRASREKELCADHFKHKQLFSDNTMNTNPRQCPFVITRGKNSGKVCGRKVVDEFCKDHMIHQIEEKHDENTCQNTRHCPFVLTRGSKKGQCCGKIIKNEQKMFCYSHDKETVFKKCPVVLNRGQRKGQTCDRRCKHTETACSMHRHKIEPTPITPTPILEEPVLQEIQTPVLEPVLQETQTPVLEPGLQETQTPVLEEPGLQETQTPTQTHLLEVVQPVVQSICAHVYTRGKNKGQVCGKKSCSKHKTELLN